MYKIARNIGIDKTNYEQDNLYLKFISGFRLFLGKLTCKAKS